MHNVMLRKAIPIPILYPHITAIVHLTSLIIDLAHAMDILYG